MQKATRALKEFNAAEAANIVAQAAAKAGMQIKNILMLSQVLWVTMDMIKKTLLKILRIRGLFSSGGRVGLHERW